MVGSVPPLRAPCSPLVAPPLLTALR
ncbi:hypothetical protein A2U01_0032919, partial [Trifolium medium]|nr:hypothetical protein [Trifolium medium]